MARAPKVELKKRDVTPADIWADQTRATCAKAMLEWLKASLNTKRPINTLTPAELKCMAEAATSTWIIEASNRTFNAPVDDAVAKHLEGILI